MSNLDKLEKHMIEKPKKNRENNTLLHFFLGLILFCVGVFLVFQNTTVSMAWYTWSIGGLGLSQGIVSIPLLIGIGLLFYNSKSIVSWLVFILGVVFVLVTIIMSVRLRFNPTSLLNYIFMFGTILAGTGLLLKSIFIKK